LHSTDWTRGGKTLRKSRGRWSVKEGKGGKNALAVFLGPQWESSKEARRMQPNCIRDQKDEREKWKD